MSRESKMPRLFGVTLATVGGIAFCTSAWNLFVALGPSNVLTAARVMAEAALTRPQELLVLMQTGHSLYAGGAGLVAVALGVVLLRIAQPTYEAAGRGVPAVVAPKGGR
jgi:hypothetical protein